MDKVCCDHLSNTVSIDEASEEGEWNKMALADLGLEVQIGNNHRPDAEEWHEAEKSTAGTVSTSATSTDDVERRLNGVENQHDAALDKVPLSEGEIVDEGRDADSGRHTNGMKHALLPEMRTADISGKDENQDDCENALDGTVDNTESQSLGVVSLPSLNVEGQES
jgi:hypothetical protein